MWQRTIWCSYIEEQVAKLYMTRNVLYNLRIAREKHWNRKPFVAVSDNLKIVSETVLPMRLLQKSGKVKPSERSASGIAVYNKTVVNEKDLHVLVSVNIDMRKGTWYI